MPDITSVGGATSVELPDREPATQQAQQLTQYPSNEPVTS